MHKARLLLGRGVAGREVASAATGLALLDGCCGCGGGGLCFALEGLQQGAQAVALGVYEVGTLSAGERGRDHAAGLEVGGLSIARGRVGIRRLLHGFAEHGEEVCGSGGGETRACRRHVEAVEEGG